MVRVQWELDKEGASFAFSLTLRPDFPVLVQVHNACSKQYVVRDKVRVTWWSGENKRSDDRPQTIKH